MLKRSLAALLAVAMLSSMVVPAGAETSERTAEAHTPTEGYYNHLVEEFDTTTLDTANKWKFTSGIDLTTNPGTLTLNNGGKCGLSDKLQTGQGIIMGKPYQDSVIVEFRAKANVFGASPGNGVPSFGFQMGLNVDKRLMMDITAEKIFTSNASGTWKNTITHAVSTDWHDYRIEITNITESNNPPVKLFIDGTEVAPGTVFGQYKGAGAPSLNFWVEQANAQIQVDSVFVEFPVPTAAETPAWNDLSVLTLAENNGSATLTWPAAYGTVTGYKIDKDGTELATVAGDVTTYTVEAEALAQETYTVQALNSAAATPGTTNGPTAVRAASPASIPNAPTNLQISAITDTTATATWAAPATGTAPASYEVHLDGVSLGEVTGLTKELTGLSFGASHKVEVLSKSAGGALSAPVEATFATLLPSDWYSYIEEDFTVGEDGKPTSGINWGGAHKLENGSLTLEKVRDEATVQNFSKPYPDRFVLEFRAKTDALPKEADWALQMQIISAADVEAGIAEQTARLMLKQGADGTMKSCTSSSAWDDTITGTPNDTEWHDYRLELNKTAKTAKLSIDGTFKATINLQEGGYTNPAFKFWKENSLGVEAHLDDVHLYFPVDQAGAPIWTPAQAIRQTGKTIDSVTVSWDKAIGTVTNYVLYKDEDEGVEVDGTATSYTFTGLTGGTGYAIRVQAKNTNGVTTEGPSVEARTKFDPGTNTVDIAPFWTQGVGGYGGYRIPGIVVTKKDTILAYCEARRGGGDWDPMDMVIRRSEDGGDTWSENRVLIPGLEKGITVNNPVIIVDNDGETLHMLYCVMYGVEGLGGSVFYMKSTDDGVTWSDPRDIGASCYPQNDPAFTSRNVIATGPGHGIQLKNGTLLVPVWMTDGPKSSSQAHQPSVVSTLYSLDKGETWQIGEIIHRNQGGMSLSNPNETTAVELSDGSVMLNIRRQWGASVANPNYRVVTVSPNGYSGWDQPKADTALMDAGNGCFGSLVRYDKDTILFTNAEDPTSRRNVTVKASFDDGKTWVAKKSLDPEKEGSTYSDIAVDSKGTVYNLFEFVGLSMRLARFNLNYLTKPFAPTAVTAADLTPVSANITWSRSPDNLGTATYNLYLGESQTPVNAQPITGTAYTLTELTGETAYAARVVEIGQVEGNDSDAATVAFTTLNGNVAPIWTAGSAVTVTARERDSLSVSWPAAYGAVTYKVYVGGVEKGTVTAPATTYQVTGLESSTTYTIKVEAVNEHGTTDNGPSVAASTRYDIASGAITSQVLMAAGDGYSDYRIPSLVTTNKGTLLAMAEARTGGGDWSPMDAVLMRSTDGGETWSERQILAAGAAEKFACNNPVLIPTKEGPVFVIYCKEYGVESRNGGVFYIKSLDDGLTWSAPVDISASCLPDYRNVIATGPGHGIQLENGRLITAVWLVPKSAGQGDTSHHPGEVSTLYSDDMGETWHIGEIIKGTIDLVDPNESTVVELSDGSVMINMRNVTGTKRRAISISKDGSTNWSTPYFDDALVEPVCFGSLVRYDENTLLFVNPDTTTSRTHGTVKVSYDDGKTWPVKRLLNEDNSTYSDIAVSTVDGVKQISVLMETSPGNTLTLYRFPLSWLEQDTAKELKSLNLSSGNLELEQGVYEYAVQVDSGVERVTIFAQPFNSEATLTCDGQPFVNGKFTVSLGALETSAVIKLTLPGGVETTYTLHFTRKIPVSQQTCVLHYTLDDLQDGRITDSSGYGNDAVITGPVTTGEGKVDGGTVMGAGGAETYLQTTSAKGLDVGTGDFTATLWIKPTILSGEQFLFWYGTPSPNANGWWCRLNGANINFLLSDGTEKIVKTTTAPIKVNEWSHIALVNEGPNIKIYVNGAIAATEAKGKDFNVSGDPTLRIGAQKANAQRIFKGNMDEVQVFNYALSATDILALKDLTAVESAAKDILMLSANGKNGKIEGSNILLKQPTGINLAAIAPEITVSQGATVSPESGVSQNFTSPVTYTVTAQDGTTKDYTVTVEIEGEAPPEEDIKYIQPAPVTVYPVSAAEGTTAKINFLGDSITYGEMPGNAGQTVKQYHAYLAEMLKLDNENYGVSGSTISVLRRGSGRNPFTVRYADMRDAADIVFVFGGTNDYGVADNAPFGTWQDREDTTFLGGLRVLIEGLIQKYPNKQIIFMTPIPRDTKTGANSVGKVLSQYVDAIKDMCEEYGVPVMDGYSAPEMNLLYNKPDLISDGLHPTAAGHKIMADWIYQQLQDKNVIEVITSEQVPAVSITLSESQKALTVGDSFTLTATVLPENATNKSVTWSSSAEGAVTVSEGGVVTAVEAGTATITATTMDGSFTATCVVTVSAYVPPYNPPSNTTTTTEKHPDGSITTTVTNKKTGTVTSTTKQPDGTVAKVETKKDGTVTAMVSTPDGTKTELVKKPDGSLTATEERKDGTKMKTATTAAGETTANVEVPKDKGKVTVTIPTPEKPAPGVVAVIVRPDGTEEVVKTSVASAEGLRITLSEGASVKLVDNSKTFADVKAADWSADAVAFVSSRELFNGTGKETFSPTAEMTRGMILTTLYRYDGAKTESTGGQWYSDAQKWAMSTNLSDGTNMEESVTREQLAILLYRYGGEKNSSHEEEPDGTPVTVKDFADGADVSSYATEAMDWAVSTGLLTGKGGNRLDPAGSATRAEVATILMRLVSALSAQ